VRALCLLFLALTATPARAASEDPDLEIAQHHFETGRAFYNAADYVHALEEFDAAYRVRRGAPLEFNIARCHDRLEHFQEALAWYEKYLTHAPNAKDANEVRERVHLLRTRTDMLPEVHPSPVPPEVAARPRPSSRKKTILAVTLSVAAALVVGASVGLGVGLSQDSYTLGTIRASK
jgi:tetratricopeptide (TPR) repeat protein